MLYPIALGVNWKETCMPYAVAQPGYYPPQAMTWQTPPMAYPAWQQPQQPAFSPRMAYTMPMTPMPMMPPQAMAMPGAQSLTMGQPNFQVTPDQLDTMKSQL